MNIKIKLSIAVLFAFVIGFCLISSVILFNRSSLLFFPILLSIFTGALITAYLIVLFKFGIDFSDVTSSSFEGGKRNFNKYVEVHGTDSYAASHGNAKDDFFKREGSFSHK